ncbi:hypothetical protein ACHAW6_002504 [Cyclotella cf. meneghiniana]
MRSAVTGAEPSLDFKQCDQICPLDAMFILSGVIYAVDGIECFIRLRTSK